MYVYKIKVGVNFECYLNLIIDHRFYINLKQKFPEKLKFKCNKIMRSFITKYKIQFP